MPLDVWRLDLSSDLADLADLADRAKRPSCLARVAEAWCLGETTGQSCVFADPGADCCLVRSRGLPV